MEIEIYADVLFFINLAMDFIILFITDKLMNTELSLKRLLLGSFVATILYCLLCFKFIFGFRMLQQLCIMAVTVVVVFRPKDIYTFLRFFLVTNLTAFSLGGISLILFFYTNFSYMGNNITAGIKNFPLSMLIIGVTTGSLIIIAAKKRYNKKLMKAQKFCNVDIYMLNKHIVLKALVDTGNSLIEPITKKPVIIAEQSAVKALFPKDIYSLLDNYSIPSEYGIKILPFVSIGERHGALIGFTADKAEIEKNVIYKPVIAVYRQSLSSTNAFNALINPEIINGGYNV